MTYEIASPAAPGAVRATISETGSADEAQLSTRESDDGYMAVVARLNDRCRVILCKDGIQWIIQRAKKGGMEPLGRAAGTAGPEKR